MFESKKNSASYAGAERRQHTRLPIELKAKMQLGEGPAVEVTMCDFSVGGMQLVSQHGDSAACMNIGKIAPGEIIRVSCHLPGNVSAGLHLQGKVVRRTDSSLGVSFIEPELAVLVQLESYAREYAARLTSGELSSHHASDPVVNSCQQLIMQSAVPVLNKFIKDIGEHLFHSSAEIKDVRIQNAYFKAMGVLSNQKEQIENNFTRSVASAMERELNQHVEVEVNPLEMDASSLSILEDNDFDDLLATTGVVDSIYNQHREQLDDLHIRLSELLGRKVDKNTNPFGPAIYAESLQKALRTLDVEHVVLMASYKVFSTVLAKMIGDVFRQLNDVLIEAGILPEIDHKIVKNEQRSSESEAQPEIEDVQQAEEDEQTAEQPIAPQNNSAANVSAQTAEQAVSTTEEDAMQALKDMAAEHSGQQESAAGSAGTKAKQTADTASANASAHRGKHSEHIISPAEALDLYDLVQDLRQLRSTVNEGAAADRAMGAGKADETATDNMAEPVLLPSFSSTQVIDALTAIESRSGERNDGKTIKERVVDALRKTSGDDDMVLADHDNKVIDVTTDVFTSMNHDLQVAAALKQWLEKLEIPLMKIALVDDTIFTDRSHIARDVINNIAMLELTGGEKENSVQSSVKQSLNWLVDLMNKEFDGSSEVFKRVNDQLELLLKVQEKEYDKNVEIVAEQSASNQELNQISEADKLISEEFAARDEQRKEMLNRVRRLHEGDWVVFETNTDDPSRLRVAWVATHTEKLVFVNLLGEKDRTTTMVELAEQLLEKTAIVIDNADDPIMDRAQYSMLQDLHQQLLHETTHDQLTGLLNRREFEKYVADALYETKSENMRHALIHLDFDQFSLINDTHGYEAGDYFLKEMSKVFQKETICDKFAGRMGSDEFGVLVKNCPLEDAMDVAYEILEHINAISLSWEDKKLPVSVSIGLVPINRKSEKIGTLMQEAESSCRVAKDLGGNRVQVYQPDHTRLSQRKESIKWASKVDEVIDNSGFSLRCQRIAPIHDIEVESAHYEVLLNAFDKDGTALPLDEFIKAAEHYNRMPAVDRWVVTSMFGWIADNSDTLGDIEKFSINLSGRSINDEDFRDFILQEIDDSGVPTEMICFEITETAGIANLSTATEFINAIKAAGCRFSLDDFGSGLSSYGYLKNLPVDYVKIDGAFVRDMANNPSDYAVVKSITEIAHFMEKFVIAEFVEDEETIRLLAEIGVDYGQGYGIEKPMPIQELLN